MTRNHVRGAPSVSVSLPRGWRNRKADTRERASTFGSSRAIAATITLPRAPETPIIRPGSPSAHPASLPDDLRPLLRPLGVIRADVPTVVAAIGQRRLPQVQR